MKIEDKSSDTSESEDKNTSRISLSLSHLEDKSFLTSDTDKEPPKPVLVNGSKAKKSKTEDSRSSEVLKLKSERF